MINTNDITKIKKHTLSIHLSPCNGAAMRVLALIERKGFSLLTCSLEEGDNSGRGLEVTIASSKTGDLLKRQLERLCDVIFVEQVLPDIIDTPIEQVKNISRSI